MFDDGDFLSDWPLESEGESEEVILCIELVSEGVSKATKCAFH